MCNMTPGKSNINDIPGEVICVVCSVYEEGFICSSDMTIHWKGHLVHPKECFGEIKEKSKFLDCLLILAFFRKRLRA